MDFDLERFKRDIAQHEMHVIRDEGLHRHLRFKKPGTYAMHFDLITWPGYLCYTGDMGTYVFRRLDDMFQFFRKEPNRPEFRIDLSYWAEKLEATDKGQGVQEFCPQKFERAVKTDVISWIRDNRDRTTRAERRELWDDVMDSVINADGDRDGLRKQIAAHDFSHRVNAKLSFHFQDFWDHTVTRYTYRFVWCCCALQWAVGQYDGRKAEAAREGATS